MSESAVSGFGFPVRCGGFAIQLIDLFGALRVLANAVVFAALAALPARSEGGVSTQPSPPLEVESESSSAIVLARIDQMRNGAPVRIGTETLASMVVLPDFYERRGYQLAWVETQLRTELLEALRASTTDGLEPHDYHVAALEELVREPSSPETDADLDMLATDGIIRLAYHLRFGKVDVATIDPDWNFHPDVEAAISGPPALALQQMIEKRSLATGLEDLRPKHWLYAALRRALATYRDIESRGGWRSIPEGPSLRPGATDQRLPALRERLAVEGHLVLGPSDTSTVYDSILVTAARHFQERHGLHPDGIVGKGTLHALNVPVTTRISQLRLSLERGRLLLHELPARFVLVNIPAFRVHYIDENSTHLASKVIVGKPFTKTPIFRAEMTYIVLNPSWTIPPGIMEREVIPGMRRDPDYLQKKGFQQIGGQIVQPPGPNNALGRIKLMFPNPHHVYLHDTPQQNLFASEARPFSSGCIRVEDVVDLAVLVVGDPEKWSKEKLKAAIDTGRTQNVSLARRIPVLVTYWTAVAGPGDESTRFFDDVYERDPELLAALDRPFQFRPGVASRAAAVSRAR